MTTVFATLSIYSGHKTGSNNSGPGTQENEEKQKQELVQYLVCTKAMKKQELAQCLVCTNAMKAYERQESSQKKQNQFYPVSGTSRLAQIIYRSFLPHDLHLTGQIELFLICMICMI